MESDSRIMILALSSLILSLRATWPLMSHESCCSHLTGWQPQISLTTHLKP